MIGIYKTILGYSDLFSVVKGRVRIYRLMPRNYSELTQIEKNIFGAIDFQQYEK